MFDIELPSTTPDGYNAVVSVDWLFRNRADIPCEEKILCGESLFVLKQQSGAKVSAISAMKAQKCLRRDHPATLATVTDVEAKEKRIEDPPIVRDSSQCATRRAYRFTSTTVRQNLSLISRQGQP